MTMMRQEEKRFRASLSLGLRVGSKERCVCMRWSACTSSGKGFGLVDEHDRDTVPDLVDKPAGGTGQTVPGLVELNGALALGTSENLEKFLADGHGSILVR